MFSRWKKAKKPKKAKEPTVFALSYMYEKGVEDGQEELIVELNKRLTELMKHEFNGKSRKSVLLDFIEIVRNAKPIKLK